MEQKYFNKFLLIWLLPIGLHILILISIPIIYGSKALPLTGEYSLIVIGINSIIILIPEGILTFSMKIFSSIKTIIKKQKNAIEIAFWIFLIIQVLFLLNTINFAYIAQDVEDYIKNLETYFIKPSGSFFTLLLVILGEILKKEENNETS